MPNAGHKWTREEEDDAVNLSRDEFMAKYGLVISPGAYRVRRAALLREGTGLRARLLALKHTNCKVCSYLKEQSPVLRKEWETELAQPTSVISHVAVAEALKQDGVDIEESSVRRHRRNHIGR